jgi:hypothetical protein
MSKPKKQKFRVKFSGTVEIELDQAVIDQVNDNWRSHFYKLCTPEKTAEHIAFAMVIRPPVQRLESHLPANSAQIFSEDNWVVKAELIPAANPRKRKKAVR